MQHLTISTQIQNFIEQTKAKVSRVCARSDGKIVSGIFLLFET